MNTKLITLCCATALSTLALTGCVQVREPANDAIVTDPVVAPNYYVESGYQHPVVVKKTYHKPVVVQKRVDVPVAPSTVPASPKTDRVVLHADVPQPIVVR